MRSLTLAALTLLTLLPVAFSFGDSSMLFKGADRDSDGRFINLKGELSHGPLSVRAPFFFRRFGTYFRSGKDAPERVDNDGAFLRANAGEGEPTVTWIGHSTLLVQTEHLTFLTDPIWSGRPSPVPLIGPSRFVDPGLALDDLPPIDFVLISHNHFDHMDLPTLRDLAQLNAETQFIVPLGNGDLLRGKGISNIQELDWGQTTTIKGASIHCLPAQHWSKRSLSDNDKALWSSWAVIGEQRRFYFAGDTGYFAGFKDIGEKLGPFDLAAMPIGAYEPTAMMREAHMNPDEAVRAAQDLGAKTVLAMHFGTFDLSDEPLSEPPIRFKAAAKNTAFGDENSWVFDIGETRVF
ncbi:MBL fold metallo-hydrolase [bacterium]|nr:MBL fold metallo-hydrolase [bacterium]